MRGDDVRRDLSIRILPACTLAELRAALGRRHVLTGSRAMQAYCQGYRFGGGPAAAVVRPGSLVELWRSLKLCVEADAIVVMQAANTGLTGGSTPNGADYDRPVVLINTGRLGGAHLLRGGEQAICLPGTTLYELEAALRPLGREPHSVIGSSCIGASVVGGVCNNSGGALVRRGPAYTELSLFARLEADGALNLVNRLGIDLPDDPEAMLECVDAGRFPAHAVRDDPRRRASDHGYQDHVREVDAATPARFNADPHRLCDASGSAGRIIVFAVRLDTFVADAATATFYLGTNNPAELTTLRREMLTDFSALPISAEYIHRDAFDLADAYGRDTVWAIKRMGTARLPALFRWKRRVDGLARRLGGGAAASDRLLQRASRWLPPHLPRRIAAFRETYEHHLILKVAEEGIAETRTYLASNWSSGAGDCFECDNEESVNAFLHRFAVAGAAVRYQAVHADELEGIVALDVALPRNARDWFERLPQALETQIAHRLYYGHFFCHVFHQDYLVRKGYDPARLEHDLHALLDERRAKYPAEHNVGQLYAAEPALVAFYRDLDPRNQFNPGIGRTSKLRDWAGAADR